MVGPGQQLQLTHDTRDASYAADGLQDRPALRFVAYHARKGDRSLLNGGREMRLRATSRAHEASSCGRGQLFVGGSIYAKHGWSLSGRWHRRTANDVRQGNRPFGRQWVRESRSPRQHHRTFRGRAEHHPNRGRSDWTLWSPAETRMMLPASDPGTLVPRCLTSWLDARELNDR